MVEPLTAGLIGGAVGLGAAPLVYVGYSALFQAAQALDNDVDSGE